MDNSTFSSYGIQERSFVAFIKRELHNAAVHAGFPESKVGGIDIVVAELTSNMMKHAGSGELLYRFSKENNAPVFEIIALDNGPGIRDVVNSMKDGVSTTKTLGQGLGAIERLSDLFQVYSIPSWGTISYCKLHTKPPSAGDGIDLMQFRVLNVAMPGETMSGDGYHITPGRKETRIFLGDGLGHGPEAHAAAKSAIDAFRHNQDNDPVEVLRSLHDQVKRTRGLVGTVVIADHETKKWKICGIGNISTRLYDGLVPKNYISYNGIIGLNIPNTLKSHLADMGKHQCVVMSSDGIRTRWELSQFPSILRYDLLVLAAAIYKDNARKNDDMSILICRT
jgi:anti-sigma regulatory factor (Ser/Thr protein kinase)